jgi:sugar/nucleoside kinase (ribokinase family)
MAGKRFEVVSFGEFLIDMVATQKNVSLFDAPAFEPKPGGAPANVAVGVARLGKRVAFVGKIGKDDFGRGLRGLLDAEGINTTGLLEDAERLTTLAIVSLSDRGDPAFAFFAGAHTTLHPDELPADIIDAGHIFHFNSVTLAHHPIAEATLAALRRAKASGAVVSYDINFRPALYPDRARAVATLRQPLADVDILKMNGAELTLLTGEADVRRGMEALEVPAQIVAVTLAEKGCLYRFGGQIYAQSVPPVKEVVDATGAGDSFMATVLAGYQQPLDADYLSRLMRRACQAGAITTTKRGAIPALPYAHQLDPL